MTSTAGRCAPHCLITDPANQEDCAGCGRRRPVSVRAPGRAALRELPALEDPDLRDLRPRRPVRDLQGHRPALVPRLPAALGRLLRAAARPAPVRGGTPDEPLCAGLHRARPRLLAQLPGLRARPAASAAGACAPLHLQRRLDDLLGDRTGQSARAAGPLRQPWPAADRPDDRAELARQEHSPGHPARARHRRAAAHPRRPRRAARPQDRRAPAQRPGRHRGAAARDEHMARLEALDRPHHRRTPRPRPAPAAAPLRRLARPAPAPRPARRHHATHGQALAAKRDHQGRHRPARLARPPTASPWQRPARRPGGMAGQRTGQPPHRRRELRPLGPQAEADQPGLRGHPVERPVRRHRHRGPLGASPPAASRRHPQARGPRRRAARPALRPAAGRHQPSDPRPRPGRRRQVRLRLGREPVVLPEPLDALVLQLAATRRGHAAIGDQAPPPGCSPAASPASPISAYQLAERLRQLGIHSGQPAPPHCSSSPPTCPPRVLARMLGIHISVAVAWQRASSRRLDGLRRRHQPPQRQPRSARGRHPAHPT